MKKLKKVIRKPKVVKRKPAKAVDYSVPNFDTLLDLSCKDWQDRIRNGEFLMPDGLVLDETRAENALKIFSYLRLPDVVGQPSFGEVGGEWFNLIVKAVFGTWNGKVRAVNEFFLLVPKKNSKTTNSAGIMLTALIENKRPNAEFLLIAPTQSVANLAFSQAAGMVLADEQLQKACEVKDYLKQIIFRKSNAKLKIKSFDPSVLTGTKPAGVLLDELHVIAEHHNADRVIGQLRGGLISQPEAFLITITTQSERVPSGVFRSELNKARKIRDGLLKLKLLPILYEFPPDIVKSNGWKDPNNWWMVTPNKDLSITIPRLMEDYASAESSGEDELRRWASQHLNIQIGMALKEDAWAGALHWLKSGIEIDLQKLLEKSEVVTIGIDGGGLDDMLALTVCGRHTETKKGKENPEEEIETQIWHTWSHAWVHKIAVERRKGEEQTYKDFEKDGDLSIITDLGDDMTELGDMIEQVLASGKLAAEQSVGVDQSGLGMILDELAYRGIDREKQIVGIPQGWRLTSAIKTAERKLADGTLQHANQNLTRWCVGNAKVEPKGNAILITKQISGSAKIDPLMAAFNAIELMSRNPAVPEKKYQMFFVGGGN